MVKLVTAKKPIEIGTIVSKPEDLFELREHPKENVKDTNAFTNFEQVKGRTIYRFLEAGHFVTPKSLEKDVRNEATPDAGFTQTVVNAGKVSVYKDGVLVASYELGTQGAKENTPQKPATERN